MQKNDLQPGDMSTYYLLHICVYLLHFILCFSLMSLSFIIFYNTFYSFLNSRNLHFQNLVTYSCGKHKNKILYVV
jgi:hypothetical protein